MIHYEDMTKEQVIRILKDTLEYAEEKDKEIKRLKKELKQAKEIALNEHKYTSEIEDKYITANNIINELEKELDRGYRDLFEYELVPGRELITNIKNYLQELKGSDEE